ncbi:MBL fold metallo-hydrolase [Melittangium boletus]|uniref:Metallo-beta-lactamase domain-containing protein n=1 Tax=Melittangium boletus DSM 14713 TaxID=1294270 RepID=A0A250IS46_9BACT|nr:MBL fold metallo-hydrolase [Melittangium boletus]ATB34070.1 hypothetical protein MEBOL_007571 [Melittangium boletus DSM 14713]
MKKLPGFTCMALLVLGAASVRAETPPSSPPQAPASHARVKRLKVTVLSTMLTDLKGLGEWGFAALIEADGHRILFDTGANPDTVLKNAPLLGVDLSTVTDVILSHNHGDHTGGLVTLRRELAKKNPAALSRVHVGRGIFWSRVSASGKSGEGNSFLAARPRYEATGGKFIEHSEPVELFPGAWLTGPIPRVHPERNWSGKGKVQTPEGLVEDTLPEELALVLDTEQGLVLVTGCAHAGVINTLELARARVREAPVLAAIGGFHLFDADEKTLAWTGGKLREMKLGYLSGAHCTGIEALHRLRELTGLERATSIVGSVGSSFELGKGLEPLKIAR